MITLKQAVVLVNQKLEKMKSKDGEARKATGATEFKNGWWISYQDSQFGGLYFVVKKSGLVLYGNPPPLQYIVRGETPVKIPDSVFHTETGC